MKHFIVCILLSASAMANGLSDYFGTYRSTDRGRTIEFSYDTRGISMLKIDGKPITTEIKYEILRTLRRTIMLSVRFEREQSVNCVMKIVFLVENGKFIMSTGIYSLYELDERGNSTRKERFLFRLEKVKGT